MQAARPRIAASIEELTRDATDRQTVHAPDGKSGSTFERLRIDGEQYFLKSLSNDEDWIMRLTGDRDHRPFLVWRQGLYHETPPCIDHTIVAMAIDGEGTSARLGILMRDVGPHLIPEGDSTVPVETHEGFIDHMAAMHAHFWGWRDTIGLGSLAHRFRFFAPDNIAPELPRDDCSPVIKIADEGWRRLADRAPSFSAVVAGIHAHPQPLAGALAATPMTFIAGDWKMGNLGRHPDGRSIVLDWAYPGEAPGCWELGWYLALNRARIPITKEDTIEWYRESLERHGTDTDGWFERQLALSLLAIAACFGWEKAHGDEDELRWWEDRALTGARLLGA